MPASTDPTAAAPHPERAVAEIDAAVAALEAQRGLLGDAVLATALAPLLERREALLARSPGERRSLVTVLFADLVGFTELSGALDAEDVRDVVGSLFTRWHRVVHEHGGVVEKFIGDACMAVFGLHRTEEDDAQRAVRAGLALVAVTAEVAGDVERRHGVLPHVRVGIDTGDVVVSTLGERPGHDFVAVGPTVNRASRLQGQAPVDGVLVSADTRRMVRGRFGLDARPSLRLKGIDQPVDAYVVLAERPRQFTQDQLGEVATAPTVGRAVELRYVQERLDDVVQDRRHCVVTVLGDAGVGKSRLLLDVDAWLAERPEPTWWFRGRAWHAGQNRAGALLRDVLAARFGISESDPADTVGAKLRDGFAAAHGEGPRAGAAAAVVGTWLGFETGTADQALLRDPQALRAEGTRALAAYLAALARTAPVVLLLEDLHWADDVSVGWLDAAHEGLSDSPVLVVASARLSLLDARPHWGEGLAHHRRLTLEPLSARECRTLVRRLLGPVGERADQVVDLVVGAADGNPFYATELVSWLVESGTVTHAGVGRQGTDAGGAAEPALVVPSTLRGVLQARLDTLDPDERGVVERAAVVGRVFWDEAVEHLARREHGPASDRRDGDAPTAPALEVLRAREIVFQRERSSVATAREYLFSHALLRDVAYDSVLRARRSLYHLGVASWLTAVAGRSGRGEEYATAVAEHLDAAGDPAAAGWYLRAGTRASQVHALPEATRLLTRAVQLATDDRTRFDALAERQAVHDRGGDRAAQREDLAAMSALCGDGPLAADPARRVRAALAQAGWHFHQSEYDLAEAVAEQAAVEADAGDLPEAHARALLLLGKSCTWRGDADRARERLDAALERSTALGVRDVRGDSLRYLAMLASNEGDYPAALAFGEDALDLYAGELEGEAVSAVLVQHATTLYHLRRLEEARAMLERVLPIFRRTGHRYGEAIARGNIGSIALDQGRLGEARQSAVEALRLMTSLGDREAIIVDAVLVTEIDLARGALGSASTHAGQALALARAVPAPLMESVALVAVACVALAQGDAARAAELAADAAGAAQAAQSPLQAAKAELVRGYASLERGGPHLAAAEEAFVTAERAFAGLGPPARELECVAGRAAARLAAGAASEAVVLVERVLPGLDDPDLLNSTVPGVVLLSCVMALYGAADARAPDVLARAQELVRARAALAGDPGLAAGYLSLPAHVSLLGWRDRPVVT